MCYIINKNIKFRACDGALWLDEDEESGITLTITTSRLLTFLLERQGKVVMRDEILSNVWDAYGLKSSNNSLNKYISDLRNLFRNRGVEEEFIVTVPRVGFMLSEAINVQIDCLPSVTGTDVSSVSQAPDTNSGESSSIKLDTYFNQLHRKPYLYYLIMLLTIALIFSPAIFKNIYFTTDNVRYPQLQKTYPLGEIDGCKVFSFSSSAPGTINSKLSIVRDILASEKLSCPADGTLFFQSSESFLYGNVGRVFLSICRDNHSKESQYSSCYNFYEVSHDLQEK